MGLFTDIFTTWQKNRTARVQARQERKIAKTRARQERRSVESLTGRTGGSGEAWAETVGNFTSSLTGMFTGGANATYGTGGARSGRGAKREPQNGSKDNTLLYAGIGIAALVLIFVVIKMRK